MEDKGEHVRIHLVENDKMEVTVQTREWNYQVRQLPGAAGLNGRRLL